MEVQWPLAIFTLFVCLTCGIMAGMSALAIKGQGEKLQFPALITAGISLIIGALGSFLHLEHWERIFNGFGHITSGITQELIGVAVLAVLMVVWFFTLRGDKGVSKILAWVTIILAIAMILATSHTYMMASRPAWGYALIVVYLVNAFVLGAVTLWAIATVKKDEVVEKWSINMTAIGALLQIVANVIFVGACSTAKLSDVGYYLDPTKMTTAPTHIENLLDVAISGDGALFFWLSLVFALIAVLCAFMAKKKGGNSLPYLIGAAVSIFISSILFRVLFYILGYLVYLLF